MRVAVIIAARDIARFLGDAIGSALSQSAGDLSVIVVDDGSTDQTQSVIAGQSSPRLHSLHTSGLGVGAARNLGARHPAAMVADALLFLDGDDWLSTDALSRLTKTLTASPDAAAAYGSFAFMPENASPGGRPSHDIRQPAPSLSLDRLILGNRFANGGHVLIRQTAWQATGGFREDLRFAEDWEFWPRLRLEGPFAALPGPPVLMVRRRIGSMMHGAATDPAAYAAALSAMADNPRLARALGVRRLPRLIRQARRELCWTIGRERLRRGLARSALPLLLRGFFGQFRPQRGIILFHAAWVAGSDKSGR
ncbi:glycosyltransferase family 2 protein [Acidisoma cellulosilytica]|uniref:Glycosyltransferase family 2 protein n=1 Tax=Acidisoma cellulosilyticum TaxID=2802395 RepID=A0A964E1N6_9PROT|nr:glycosyltransferase family A protein [Acidisoma cellulosilyticum]MCB8878715.1 glycosyltransferase family 2 protein [Acidisoma cellulosilyticum]